jgi:hypothetical protein
VALEREDWPVAMWVPEAHAKDTGAQLLEGVNSQLITLQPWNCSRKWSINHSEHEEAKAAGPDFS